MPHPKGTGYIMGEVIVEKNPIDNTTTIRYLPMEAYWRGELKFTFGPPNFTPLFGEINGEELIAEIEGYYERKLSPEDRVNLTAYVNGELDKFSCEFKLMEY